MYLSVFGVYSDPPESYVLQVNLGREYKRPSTVTVDTFSRSTPIVVAGIILFLCQLQTQYIWTILQNCVKKRFDVADKRDVISVGS